MQSSNGRQNFVVGVKVDPSDVERSKRQLHSIGQTATQEGEAIDASMNKIGAAIAGVFAVSTLQKFASQVSTVRGEFQQLEIAFQTMLGSKQQADSLMNQLIQTAVITPFNMSDIAKSAKQLLAYGVAADEVNETLVRLGDIAAGLSIPINDLAYLYGTTMVQGRMYTQDLNQFLGRGIPLTEELAKQFGVNKNEVKELVTAGKVGFPEVKQAIIDLTSEGGKFGGLMEAQSKSITGQMSNIEDSIEQMFNEIGKKTEGVISTSLSGVSTIIDNWEKIGKVLIVVIAAYGAYKAAVLAVWAVHKLVAIWGMVQEFIALTKGITSAKNAMLVFNNVTRMNPVGLILGVVAAAATAFALFSDSADKAADAVKAEADEVARFNERVGAEASKSTTAYKKLQAEYKACKTEHEKTEWIKRNSDKFTELGISVTSVTTAENVFIRNTSAMMSSFKKRAEAAAWQDKLNEAYAKRIEREIELEQKRDNIRAGSRVPGNSHTTAGGNEYVNSAGQWVYTAQGAAEAVKKFNERIKNDPTLTEIDKQIDSYSEKIDEVSKSYEELIKEAGTTQLSDKEKNKVAQDAKKANNEQKQIAAQTADRNRAIERYRDSVIEQTTRAELDIRQARIDTMEDGYDKELAAITLNYDRLIQANADRERQMIEALADNKVNEWLNKHPKATKEQQLDYRKSLLSDDSPTRLTSADLTKEQQDQLKAYSEVANDIQTKAKQELYKRLLAEYQDYNTRRKAEDDKYNAERKALEEAPIDSTARKAALAEMERRHKEAIQGITNEEAAALQKSSSLLVDLFTDAADKSDKEIQKMIADTKALLSYLKNTPEADITPMFGFTAEQLKTLKASPEALKEIIDQVKRLQEAARKSNPFRALAESIKALSEKPKDGENGKSWETKLQEIGRAAAACADMIGGVVGRLAEMFEAAGNTEMADAMEQTEQILGGISNIGKGLAEGGLIGGIAALIGEAINLITSAFQANARHKEALKEIMQEATAQQQAYNLALLDEALALKSAETVFGQLDYRKAVNAVSVMNDALTDLNKGIDENLRNIEIKTGHKKTGLFGWGKGKDLYSSILDVYPELIDKSGKFNRELAQSILESQTFNGEGKEALQNLIDLYDKAEEAYENVKNYLSGIFGNLGNTMSDALVDAFRDGSDAATAFGNSVSEMLENIGKQMIFSSLFDNIIQQANDSMLATMTDISLTEEQKFNQYVAILDQMTSGILGQQSTYEALLRRYKQMAEAKGIDLFAPNNREGMSKGIASASQDSVNELNGRMTAVQGHTYAISENSRLLLNTTNAILDSVINIEHNTDDVPRRLGTIENNVSQLSYAVNDISIRGVKIKNS